ncbi:MAG: hypothetical protein IKZ88_10065 [Neisseriaceae bacterium]|nr:hypothetical protein [Neisseriaceae bacterium]
MCSAVAVGWEAHPTALLYFYRVGIPAHRNGRNHFRLPENKILPLYCILPLRWVENPPYNQACGLAVGWEALPISTCGALVG